MNNNSVHIQMNFSLYKAHGTVMILAWMIFGSTGIIFARYGRSLRFGNRRQFLGKAFWFQIHRFLLTFTPLLTLLGFFLILVRTGGIWVSPQIFGIRSFLHSVFGGIIVCCTIVQIWLALYRCHPRSRFRFCFDWSHRMIGFLAFSLSIPNIFLNLNSIVLSMHSTARIVIISIWTGWIVIIVIIFEKIEYQQRATVAPRNGRGDEPTQDNTNAQVDIESGTNANVGNKYLNFIKLIIILLHIPISITLAILLIIFIYF